MLKAAGIAVALAGLLGSTAVVLAGQIQGPFSPSVMSAVQPTSGEPDQIVCRTMDPPTGTRLGARRVCRTQRQWDGAVEVVKRQLLEMQTDIGQGTW